MLHEAGVHGSSDLSGDILMHRHVMSMGLNQGNWTQLFPKSSCHTWTLLCYFLFGIMAVLFGFQPCWIQRCYLAIHSHQFSLRALHPVWWALSVSSWLTRSTAEKTASSVFFFFFTHLGVQPLTVAVCVKSFLARFLSKVTVCFDPSASPLMGKVSCLHWVLNYVMENE